MTGVARGTGLDAKGGVPGNIVGVCPCCLVYKEGIFPVGTPTFLSGQEPAMMYAESTTAIPKSRNNFKEQSLASHRAVFIYFHFALRVNVLLRNILLCFRVLNSESKDLVAVSTSLGSPCTLDPGVNWAAAPMWREGTCFPYGGAPGNTACSATSTFNQGRLDLLKKSLHVNVSHACKFVTTRECGSLSGTGCWNDFNSCYSTKASLDAQENAFATA